MKSRVQIPLSSKRKARFPDQALHGLATALLIFGLVLSWMQPVPAQAEPGSPTPTKADLEYQKLKLEVDKLNEKESEWSKWLPILLGFVGAAAGTFGSFWVARRSREGAIDQATHQKRLECYPHLIKATARLALYFPEFVYGSGSLDVDGCRAIGRELSRWYFDGGGLLLSVPARDAYFALARALTKASFASELRVPDFRKDAKLISREKIDAYCKSLGAELTAALDEDVDKWEFGGSAPLTTAKQTPANSMATSEGTNKDYERFKDYVFLQQLSSRLRTALADDLRSRRRLS